jgi:hypothetical protein
MRFVSPDVVVVVAAGKVDKKADTMVTMSVDSRMLRRHCPFRVRCSTMNESHGTTSNRKVMTTTTTTMTTMKMRMMKDD